MRGSCALPALTPRRPPQRIAMSSSRSNSCTSNPKRSPSSLATSASATAVRWLGGALHRSRAMFAARALIRPIPVPSAAWTGSVPSAHTCTSSSAVNAPPFFSGVKA